MKLLLGVLLTLLSIQLDPALGAGTTARERAAELEVQGDFVGAAQVLEKWGADKQSSKADRKIAEFELDRLTRIRKDFPFSAESLFQALQRSVRDLQREEYASWVSQGRFDSRVIDGQRYFMSSSVANLFFRYPELNPRRIPAKDTSDVQREHLRVARQIRAAALAQNTPYVLPRHFRMTMTVTAAAGAAPEGETVRAWLPVPRSYPFQGQFRLISSSPAVKRINSEVSPIRSVFLEQKASATGATVFTLEYDYVTHGVSFNPQPDRVRAAAVPKALKPYTGESPHVSFSPEMRALLDRIVGSEQNPCRAAKLIYDWISENIKYSYAIEYSTIRNISEYCRERGYGDCGQEALLLITLCRLQGIPARWQSGWSTFPGAKTIHDWAEIYLEPYGWMPVDVYMGIYAQRYATALTAEEQRELRGFYFGGLDQYRMVANSDHSRELTPAKRSMRSDTVDFQRGELEANGKNIYFDQFKYDLQVREIAEP